MKRIWVYSICAVVILSIATPAMAGSWRRGKRVYKKVCIECHQKGEEAGKISPLDKTKRQWRRFFKKDKHKVDSTVWKDLSRKDRDNLQKYMIKYAADADQPGTCG